MTGERQPLLGASTEATDRTAVSDTTSLVDFDAEGDPENPLEWPAPFKWGIVALLAFMAFTVTFTCISVVPVASRIVADLDGQPNKSASVLLVTIWELGEAVGPLLIAPLSEMYGRYPVMNVANCLFIAATILAALCESSAMLIAARALTGLAVASNVLGPAIVGDIFISEQRGSAMSLVMLAPLLGGAVGPAIAGAIAQSLGWRQVLWMSACLAGVCELLFLTCFRETYKVPILRRRAARLRLETGDASLRTAFDQGGEKAVSAVRESVLRPVLVLFGSGVLVAMAVWGAVSFSFFYVMSVTLPDILEGIYGLSPALAGSAFMSFSVGSIMGVMVCNRYLDRIYIRLRDANHGVGRPEHRLPLAISGASMLPLAIAAYAWCAELRLPLAVLLLTVAWMGFSLLLAALPLTAYVVDACGLYSASAMTGVIVTRCLAGTFLPLTTAPLIEQFGHGWGLTALAALGLLLLPIPILTPRYGARWRQFSVYTRDA